MVDLGPDTETYAFWIYYNRDGAIILFPDLMSWANYWTGDGIVTRFDFEHESEAYEYLGLEYEGEDYPDAEKETEGQQEKEMLT